MLASHRDVRCRASTETIKAALNGNDRAEHIFALTQSLELYDFYRNKMLECDRHLEATLAALGANTEHDPNQLPRPRTKTKQVSTPSFDVRAALFGVLGVDLTLERLAFNSNRQYPATPLAFSGHWRYVMNQ